MAALNPYRLPELEFVGGSSQELVFHTYFYANRAPFDLSACRASFGVVSFLNKTGDPIISKEMQVTSGTDGDYIDNVLRVVLGRSDTIDLSGKYIYQITIEDIESGDRENLQGIMYIFRNINRDV